MVPILAEAQAGTQAQYLSETDEALRIQSVVVAPIVDNVNGIYSKPITEKLIEQINLEKQWFVKTLTQNQDSDFYEPDQALKIINSNQVDCLLSSRVLRGPNGISLRVNLFTKPYGEALIQESKNLAKTDSLEEIQNEFTKLYQLALTRLPFDGQILSRRGLDVTLDVGSLKGVKQGQTIEVLQVLKIDRHPKHKFIISSDKTITGKILISKVEPTLSFGKVIFEKERGVVVVGSKIITNRSVTYASSSAVPQDPAFGDNPKEWRDETRPQFGRLSILAGIGQYNQSANLVGLNDVSANSPTSPTIKVEGELWLSSEWFLSVALMQSALTLSNPINGDSPKNLNTTLSSYTLSGGYNWLLDQDFYGPKIQISGGLHQWTSDPARSTQVAFTRMQFGGMYLGFDGSFTLDPESLWSMGTQFKFYLSKNVSDSPKSGDSSNETINDFGVYVRKKKSERLSYVGRLNFENYSSSYSGASSRPNAARKISHRNQLILLGIEYGF